MAVAHVHPRHGLIHIFGPCDIATPLPHVSLHLASGMCVSSHSYKPWHGCFTYLGPTVWLRLCGLTQALAHARHAKHVSFNLHPRGTLAMQSCPTVQSISFAKYKHASLTLPRKTSPKCMSVQVLASPCKASPKYIQLTSCVNSQASTTSIHIMVLL